MYKNLENKPEDTTEKSGLSPNFIGIFLQDALNYLRITHPQDIEKNTAILIDVFKRCVLLENELGVDENVRLALAEVIYDLLEDNLDFVLNKGVELSLFNLLNRTDSENFSWQDFLFYYIDLYTHSDDRVIRQIIVERLLQLIAKTKSDDLVSLAPDLLLINHIKINLLLINKLGSCFANEKLSEQAKEQFITLCRNLLSTTTIQVVGKDRSGALMHYLLLIINDGNYSEDAQETKFFARKYFVEIAFAAVRANYPVDENIQVIVEACLFELSEVEPSWHFLRAKCYFHGVKQPYELDEEKLALAVATASRYLDFLIEKRVVVANQPNLQQFFDVLCRSSLVSPDFKDVISFLIVKLTAYFEVYNKTNTLITYLYYDYILPKREIFAEHFFEVINNLESTLVSVNTVKKFHEILTIISDVQFKNSLPIILRIIDKLTVNLNLNDCGYCGKMVELILFLLKKTSSHADVMARSLIFLREIFDISLVERDELGELTSSYRYHILELLEKCFSHDYVLAERYLEKFLKFLSGILFFDKNSGKRIDNRRMFNVLSALKFFVEKCKIITNQLSPLHKQEKILKLQDEFDNLENLLMFWNTYQPATVLKNLSPQLEQSLRKMVTEHPSFVEILLLDKLEYIQGAIRLLGITNFANLPPESNRVLFTEEFLLWAGMDLSPSGKESFFTFFVNKFYYLDFNPEKGHHVVRSENVAKYLSSQKPDGFIAKNINFLLRRMFDYTEGQRIVGELLGELSRLQKNEWVDLCFACIDQMSELKLNYNFLRTIANEGLTKNLSQRRLQNLSIHCNFASLTGVSNSLLFTLWAELNILSHIDPNNVRTVALAIINSPKELQEFYSYNNCERSYAEENIYSLDPFYHQLLMLLRIYASACFTTSHEPPTLITESLESRMMIMDSPYFCDELRSLACVVWAQECYKEERNIAPVFPAPYWQKALLLGETTDLSLQNFLYTHKYHPDTAIATLLQVLMDYPKKENLIEVLLAQVKTYTNSERHVYSGVSIDVTREFLIATATGNQNNLIDLWRRSPDICEDVTSKITSWPLSEKYSVYKLVLLKNIEAAKQLARDKDLHVDTKTTWYQAMAGFFQSKKTSAKTLIRYFTQEELFALKNKFIATIGTLTDSKRKNTWLRWLNSQILTLNNLEVFIRLVKYFDGKQAKLFIQLNDIIQQALQSSPVVNAAVSPGTAVATPAAVSDGKTELVRGNAPSNAENRVFPSPISRDTINKNPDDGVEEHSTKQSVKEPMEVPRHQP